MMRNRTLLTAVLLGLVLVALPLIVGRGVQFALVNALIAALFAASFNLLMGQGGMLSFGHAAYYGIGAFAVLHLMRAIEAGLGFPTVLLPLAGGVAGLLVGLLFGFFATQRAGVYFSLVTLAVAELLHVLAPRWEGLFGGEAGLTSMRMPSFGISFGTPLEVYYFALVWVVVCIGLLYAYTRTPFGRLTLALRDNEQRVRFMGYNAHATKVVVFAVSTMFSGIAGGLLAVANESANYNIFSVHTSSQVVLATFVGGSTVFLGPIVGAFLLALFSFAVSDATHSWLLYEGIVFVLVILYAPNGIAGVIQSHLDQRHTLPWPKLWLPYLTALVASVFLLIATIFTIQSVEIVFSEQYRNISASTGRFANYPLFGTTWNPFSPVTWLFPAVLFIASIIILRRSFARINQLWAGDSDNEPSIPFKPTALSGSGAH
jgi:branched-chain amino acid transport system permease protein